MNPPDKYILKDASATGPGTAFNVNTPGKTLQLIGSTESGSGAASVIVQVTNDPTKTVWINVGTIDLVLGTIPTTDGFAIHAQWDYVRGNVSSISGTGAKLQLLMSNERTW